VLNSSPPKQSELLVRLSDLTKRYRTITALRGVNLEVRRGVTGLLGPNGSGKTTLIKVLLGLLPKSSGEGEILGHTIGSNVKAIRAQIGYMPEDDCYLAGVSGIEMMKFVAQLSGLPSFEALRRAHEILDFCGVEQERYRQVDTYSIGMRQKLKFAQSIVHDPAFLILDEPTTGLDPDERTAMLNRIRLLADKHGKTVLLSTHILPDVQAVCDDVIILAKGEVVISNSLAALNLPEAPTYLLRVASDPQQFVAALAEKDVDSKLLDNGNVRITGKSGGQNNADVATQQVAEVVFEIARIQNTQVRVFRPEQNSLESIFLKAVRQAEGGKDANL